MTERLINLWDIGNVVDRVVTNQVYSINDLKRNQIETYFDERYADIEVLADSQNIKRGI
ncbi:hypothetical protein [Cellulosilyticum ruminicola]|uniref:hypothetical protein n=1 Tax=Cellulosilyticum ruminicola TaxID=425254 RepID=UPI00155DD3CC|nr:hypothetical protein [Cellulosilyticum ruminicola]